jgi:hypothetical protein
MAIDQNNSRQSIEHVRSEVEHNGLGDVPAAMMVLCDNVQSLQTLVDELFRRTRNNDYLADNIRSMRANIDLFEERVDRQLGAQAQSVEQMAEYLRRQIDDLDRRVHAIEAHMAISGRQR